VGYADCDAQCFAIGSRVVCAGVYLRLETPQKPDRHEIRASIAVDMTNEREHARDGSESSDRLALRAGEPADAAALERMSTGPIAGKRRFIDESLQRRDVVTARAEGELAGYIIWDRAFFGRPFVWLLGIDPRFRRRGIGRRLLREFEVRCAGESLFTSTNESNLAMQRLLEAGGFVRSGRLENLDPGDPEIFYYKNGEKGGRRAMNG
jgi:ribosomal protein S18 acetylase RimI-like enzyme